MIIYERLWETMRTRGITQYRLIKYYGFSSGQLDRLKKNSYVSTHTIEVLCAILDCKVEDIMEFRYDSGLNPGIGTSPTLPGIRPALPGGEPPLADDDTPAGNDIPASDDAPASDNIPDGQ